MPPSAREQVNALRPDHPQPHPSPGCYLQRTFFKAATAVREAHHGEQLRCHHRRRRPGRHDRRHLRHSRQHEGAHARPAFPGRGDHQHQRDRELHRRRQAERRRAGHQDVRAHPGTGRGVRLPHGHRPDRRGRVEDRGLRGGRRRLPGQGRDPGHRHRAPPARRARRGPVGRIRHQLVRHLRRRPVPGQGGGGHRRRQLGGGGVHLPGRHLHQADHRHHVRPDRRPKGLRPAAQDAQRHHLPLPGCARVHRRGPAHRRALQVHQGRRHRALRHL